MDEVPHNKKIILTFCNSLDDTVGAGPDFFSNFMPLNKQIVGYACNCIVSSISNIVTFQKPLEHLIYKLRNDYVTGNK